MLIPGQVWKSMKGISWSKGCVKRSRLRLIEVNYRGYDGYRHRGQIVVARSIGSKAARAFKRLYQKGFPIRSMQLVDAFGKNRGGRPGANDYKSMEAGTLPASTAAMSSGASLSGSVSALKRTIARHQHLGEPLRLAQGDLPQHLLPEPGFAGRGNVARVQCCDVGHAQGRLPMGWRLPRLPPLPPAELSTVRFPLARAPGK